MGEGHGYGVKSIKYIAESHGGAVSAVVDDGIFILQIVIPQPENEKK